MRTERKERFRLRFEKYYPMLCNMAFGYLHDADTSEDVVQEIFITVWDREKDDLPDEALAAYLKTAVRNNCLTYLRKNRRYDTVSMDETAAAVANLSGEEESAHEYRTLLDALLAQLPPKCKEVFLMNKLYKMRYREIADSLGISEKTVESHMGRALRIARAYVMEHPALLLTPLFLQLIAIDL